MRVTQLDPCGAVPEDPSWIVSDGAISVSIGEITHTHSGGAETNETTGEIVFVHPEREEVIGYSVDIDMLRVDPDIIRLVSGNPEVMDYNTGDIIGFGVDAGVKPRTFALEVWTKLSSSTCAGKWGYTLFPRLYGGHLKGHTVQNGLSTFSLSGARCLRGSKWGNTPAEFSSGFGNYGFGLGPFGLDPLDVSAEVETPYNRFWTAMVVDGCPIPSRSISDVATVIAGR